MALRTDDNELFNKSLNLITEHTSKFSLWLRQPTCGLLDRRAILEFTKALYDI